MANISVTMNGMEFDNPFLLGSGPPGTNARVIMKAFKAGWGGVVAKTTSLTDTEVINVVPRYGKLRSESGDVIGFQNIELISDRPFEDWEEDYKQIKAEYPKKILVGSIMESYEEKRWVELAQRCEAAGCDALELNFSCPHGHPERGMGAAMGQDPERVKTVTGWVTKSVKIPVWAKMTPNITDIAVPSKAATDGGAHGIAAINTILSVVGINLDTLKPLPTVEGMSTPGGYSCQAVKPIGLRMVRDVSMGVDVPISGIGGVMKSSDAVEFILMGATTVQVCTGAMLQGLGMIEELNQGLSDFMDKHGFEKVEDFIGKALPHFTTHHHLVELQAEKRAEKKAARASADRAWGEKDLAVETAAMTSNE